MDQICRTCHYFDPVPSEPRDWRPSLGLCTHPNRATSGLRILVQPREMRCRRGFGQDDWSPAEDAKPTDEVIDERPAPRRHWQDAAPRLAAPRMAAFPIYLDLGDAVAD